MIVNDESGRHSLFGQGCAYCGKPVSEYPFINWDFKDNDCYAVTAFHPECANKFILRMARDLYEIDAGH